MRTVLLALALAAAHPLHSSSAEIIIDRRTGDLVVTIRAFLNDVTSDVGSLAPEAWLRRDFRLRDARGAPIVLRLVEQRVRADVVYFTLRATAPSSLAGTRVHHALLQRRVGRSQDPHGQEACVAGTSH